MATSEDEVRHARDALTRYEEARGPGMDWPYWAGSLCDSLEQLLGTAAAEREDTARELRDTRAALAAVVRALPAAQIGKSDLTRERAAMVHAARRGHLQPAEGGIGKHWTRSNAPPARRLAGRSRWCTRSSA